MPRGKQLSREECMKINKLLREGKSNRTVANEIGRSEGTIRNYLKRGKASPVTKRTGRRPKLNDRESRRVVRLAVARNLSASQISSQLPCRPSKSTVLRVLRKHRYITFAKSKLTPTIKPHHKKARVAFAERYRGKRVFWRRVVFTDEKKFNLDGPDGFRYYWHDMRAEPKYMSKRVNGGGSVMIWAGVNWYGNTEIVFLKGKQGASNYTETLRSSLLPYMRELKSKIGDLDPIFQHDNASIHSARLTKDFLAVNNVTTLPWPAKSPDLNIVENVWGVLARRTAADLIKQIKLEWSRIDPAYIKKLVRSVPKRLEATRLLKGAKTPY
ncbi:Transposase [Phytophthora palmivora]|uniref:Transposase n=1 Tax=Phytophthora palmivora TaxID=4796 RepID=A0A2P4YDR4_9STRA|nr:Transposase [Phytophthora palmivora]